MNDNSSMVNGMTDYKYVNYEKILMTLKVSILMQSYFSKKYYKLNAIPDGIKQSRRALKIMSTENTATTDTTATDTTATNPDGTGAEKVYSEKAFKN